MKRTAPLMDVFPVLSRPYGQSRRECQVIACSACPQEEVHFFNNRGRLSFEAASAHFGRHGWVVDRRGRHLCHACQTRVGRKPPEAPVAKTATPVATPPVAPLQKENVMPPIPAPAVKLPRPAPTPAVKEAKKLARIALDENYDPKTCAYRPGWSDERIAREFGVSREWVAERREDELGPLAPPDTLVSDLQAQIGLLSMAAKDVRASLDRAGFDFERILVGFEAMKLRLAAAKEKS